MAEGEAKSLFSIARRQGKVGVSVSWLLPDWARFWCGLHGDFAKTWKFCRILEAAKNTRKVVCGEDLAAATTVTDNWGDV